MLDLLRLQNYLGVERIMLQEVDPYSVLFIGGKEHSALKALISN